MNSIKIWGRVLFSAMLFTSLAGCVIEPVGDGGYYGDGYYNGGVRVYDDDALFLLDENRVYPGYRDVGPLGDDTYYQYHHQYRNENGQWQSRPLQGHHSDNAPIHGAGYSYDKDKYSHG